MKVSIVIPTHNRSALITRSINSILQQTYSNWELIIVDDGSTDNTKEIISPFLSDTRIKYLAKAKTGAAESRNVGANHATAELLTFLDSDDEVENDWLELMTGKMADKAVAVVCCGGSTFNKEGNLIRPGLPENLGPAFDFFKGKFSNAGVFMLRKSVFDAVGGYDTDLKAYQHTELALRLVPYLTQHELQIATVEKSLLKIHVHGGPRIRDNHEKVFEGTQRLLDLHFNKLKRDKPKLKNFLLTLVFRAWKAGRKHNAKPYVYILLKNFPLNPKAWYYFGVYLFR